MRAQLPEPVEDLVAKIRNPLMQIEFLHLLATAKLLEPVLVEAETAARMVRPYTWFLDHAGTEGIKLTSAGYLPPADVEAAAAELGLAGEWIGKLNREVQTTPVLDFRESMMRWACSASTAARCWPPRPAAHARQPGQPVVAPGRSTCRRWALRPETHASILLLAAVVIGPEAAPDPLDYVARIRGKRATSAATTPR